MTNSSYIQMEKHIWHDKFYIQIQKHNWHDQFYIQMQKHICHDKFYINIVTFDLPGYGVRYMELSQSSGVFGMLQRIVSDLAMNDDWRGIQLDLLVE